MDGDVNIPTQRQLGKLAKALAAAQGAIQNAAKDAKNPAFKRPDGNATKYADLTAVWDACREALSKNEIAVIQAPEVFEGRLVLHTTLVHSSGEWISGTYPINPLQNTPQAFGSAMTYARRYSLASMVGVAPEGDDDDGNAGSSGNGRAPSPGATRDTSPPPQVVEKAKPRAKPVATVEPRDADKPKIKAWCDAAFDHIATATHMDTVLAWENDNRAALDRLASTWTAQYERLSLVLKEKYAELEPSNG